MTEPAISCALCEDSDQPGHLSSLINILDVRMKADLALRYTLRAQQRLFVCVVVLRPGQLNGSCRARSVYLTTRILGRLSPLSG